jgi:hypothetical protein
MVLVFWIFNNKNKIILAKNIKRKITDIIKNKTNEFNYLNFSQNDLEQLSYFIKNGIYLNKDSLEILIKLCLIISDIEWILPHKNNLTITFIGIKKILNTK